MDLDISEAGDAAVVTVRYATFDIEHADGFKAAVAEALERDPKRLIVDLSRVTFMDSSGLGALIFTHRKMDGRAALVINPGNRLVMDVLKLTRVDRVLPVFPTLDAAIAA